MEYTATSTTLLQGILDASPDAINVYQAVRNHRGDIVDMRLAMTNEQSARMLNLSAETAIGQSFTDVAPENIRTEQYVWLIRVAETGVPFERELSTRLLQGIVWMKVSIRRFDEYVVITHKDITQRKRIEQQRQEEQELLENIFSNLYLGIVQYEAVRLGNPDTGTIVDFRLKRINDVALLRTGYTRDAVIGRLATEIHPAYKTSGMLDRFLNVCRTGEPYQREVYTPEFNSWYELAVTKLGDGIVITSNDITHRKQAEQERQRQATLLQTVMDNAPIGIILAEALYDQNGQITDFRYQLTNQFNANATGHTVAAMNGRAISELFPGWQSIPLFTDMREVVQSGEPRQYTDEYNNFGIHAWYEYYLSKQGNGVLITFLDVTKLKESELQLEKQANLLQTVVNNSPTGIVLHKAVRDAATGQIIDFTHELSNPANDAVTGRNADELREMRVVQHYPTNLENGHFDALVQVVETGKPQRRLLEYRSHGIDGWFDAQYVKQGDGVLFTYLDVSESQQYRRQIEAANLELHRSNDNLRQFAYVASHDLQEPLRKIQQFGDLLIREHADTLGRSGQDYLQRMQVSAHRMSLLIKDLLAYSRLTTHREPFKPVDINAVVSDVLDSLSVSIQESGATLTVENLPTLPGDSFQLAQLFQNLISNALKFRRTDSSGKLIQPTISLRSRRVNSASLPDDLLLQTQIQMGGGKKAGRWFYELSLTDNGIGFDEKYLDRIFQVFQRLHGKNQFQGSGVGLAICRKVIENHNGAITASSRPDVGTTFRVYLPE